MYENKLVSVILPVYNAEKFVFEAIQSVLSQSHKNLELIVIDDASADSSLQILQSFDDPRVKIFSLTKNEGVANARNIGLKKSSGEFIAFIDSDDVWLPDKLTEQLKFLECEKVDLCYSYFDRSNPTGNYLSTVSSLSENLKYSQLLKSNCIPMLTAIVRKDSIGDTTFKSAHHEDYIFWLELTRNKKLTGKLLKKVTAIYRVRSDSISGNKIKSFLWTWKVYRRFEHISLLKSCKLIIFYLNSGIKKHK